jgi:hypothetical protein
LIVHLGGGRRLAGLQGARHDVIWRKTSGKSGFRIRRGDFRRSWSGRSDRIRDHLDLLLIGLPLVF